MNMNEEFNDYFYREIEYFRKTARVFGERNAKIAGRLRDLEVGEHADPHVSRLVESFAFLNAQIRLKLEDEFPELCQAYLQSLYPEYLSPFPSCGVVSFASRIPHTVDRHTELQTPTVNGEPCQFRTAYPVEVWPLADRSSRCARSALCRPENVTPSGSRWCAKDRSASDLQRNAD